MTKDEVIKVLAILKSNYFQYFKSISKNDAMVMIELWNEMFNDDSADLVTAAVKSYIVNDTSGYPPTVGMIKENMFNLKFSNEMLTPTEAWNEVRKAISSFDVNDSFNKLSLLTQKAVGSPKMLREWGRMDESTVNSVIASNFKKEYRETLNKFKNNESLPLQIKQQYLSENVKQIGLNVIKKIESEE